MIVTWVEIRNTMYQQTSRSILIFCTEIMYWTPITWLVFFLLVVDLLSDVYSFCAFCLTYWACEDHHYVYVNVLSVCSYLNRNWARSRRPLLSRLSHLMACLVPGKTNWSFSGLCDSWAFNIWYWTFCCRVKALNWCIWHSVHLSSFISLVCVLACIGWGRQSKK